MIKVSSIYSATTCAVLGTLVSVLIVGCGGSEQEGGPAVIDELVENALEPQFEDDFDSDADFGGDSDRAGTPSLEFVEGAPIPPDFPKDLPFPEGAELVGAFDNPDSDAVSMAVPGSPKELVVSMESDYVDQGWEVTGAETNGRGEGMILATKDGRSVMTLIQSDESGKSVVKTIAIEGVVK